MPAVSEAQRRYLNMRFGHAWVSAHHFDNPGPLPAHVRRRSRRRRRRRISPLARAATGRH